MWTFLHVSYIGVHRASELHVSRRHLVNSRTNPPLSYHDGNQRQQHMSQPPFIPLACLVVEGPKSGHTFKREEESPCIHDYTLHFVDPLITILLSFHVRGEDIAWFRPMYLDESECHTHIFTHASFCGSSCQIIGRTPPKLESSCRYQSGLNSLEYACRWKMYGKRARIDDTSGVSGP